MNKRLITTLSILGGLIFLFGFYNISEASVLHKPPNNLNLVGNWSLEDATGTIATDFSGQANHGTLNNMEIEDWIDGKIGTGLTFDGASSNEYVSMSSTSALEPTGAITVSIWAKFNELADTQTLIGHHNSSNVGWAIWATTGTTLRFTLGDGTNDYHNNLIASLSAAEHVGSWHHYVMTFDGDVGKGYIDGVEVDSYSKTTTLSYAGADVPKIGQRQGSGDGYFNGGLDEARVYSRALGATEVEDLFKSSLAKISKNVNVGLVAHYTFEDGTGSSVLTDVSDQGHNGTLNDMDANTDWVDGKSGFSTALDFDGTNDFVNIGNDPNLRFGTGDFAIALWFYPRADEATHLLGKDVSGSRDWTILTRSGNKFAWNDFSVGITETTATYDLDDWTHAVVSRKDGELSLYLDGNFDKTATYGTNYNLTNEIHIGEREWTGAEAWFDGLIDDLRFYNRALSPAEITAIHTATSDGRKKTKLQTSKHNQLTEGLVGMWDFNGRSINGTTVTDVSSNSNNGTLTSGPIPTIGRVGQGLELDDSAGHNVVITDADSLDILNTITISAWIKPEVVGSSDGIFSKRVAAEQAGNYAFRFDASGKLALLVWSPNTSATSDSAIVAGEWTHVAVTFSDGDNTSRFYINGALDKEDTTSITSNLAVNSEDIRIGYDGQSSGYFDGVIDEVRLYDRVLSADEIAQLYSQGAAR